MDQTNEELIIENFNLKMQINKQNEELIMLRNGIDIIQLMEIMKEKDDDVENMKGTIDKLQSRISELILQRNDLIQSSESIYNELNIIKNDNNNNINKIQLYNEIIINKDSTISDLNDQIKSLEENINNNINTINKLNDEMRSKDNDIYQLQSRCAKLVKEKSEVNKTLEKEQAKKDKELNEYKKQIEKGIYYNKDIKEKLLIEHNRVKDLNHRIETLHNSIQSLTNELSTNKINYKREIDSLTNQLENLHNNIVTTTTSSDKYISNEDIDKANKRIIELEHQIKKQNNYMKSKILKDKTNTFYQTNTYSNDPVELSPIKKNSYSYKSKQIVSNRIN